MRSPRVYRCLQHGQAAPPIGQFARRDNELRRPPARARRDQKEAQHEPPRQSRRQGVWVRPARFAPRPILRAVRRWRVAGGAGRVRDGALVPTQSSRPSTSGIRLPSRRCRSWFQLEDGRCCVLDNREHLIMPPPGWCSSPACRARYADHDQPGSRSKCRASKRSQCRRWAYLRKRLGLRRPLQQNRPSCCSRSGAARGISS